MTGHSGDGFPPTEPLKGLRQILLMEQGRVEAQQSKVQIEQGADAHCGNDGTDAHLTVHRWFAAKACPGDWLYSRHGQIAAEVNKRLEAAKAGKDEETMDTKQLTSCADTGDNPSAWAKEATDYCKRKGIFAGDGAGNYGWQKPITREATAQIIYNLLEAAGMLEKLPDVK